MNYSRVSLNIVYGSFVIWILGYILSQLAPIINFPIVLVYLMIYPFGAILLAIVLLIAGERWLSEERVMALVLCIPLIITIVAPYVENQIKLHLMNPDIPMIESHFEGMFPLTNTTSLDTLPKLIEYDRDSSLLKLNMKIDPEKFIKYIIHWQTNQYDIVDYPQRFMNLLRENYIEAASVLDDYTLVADELIVYGYWGDDVIVKSYFKKENNEYNLIEPYPELTLVSENNQWYLEYKDESDKYRIFVMELTISDFSGNLPIRN
jgi:hypothetical protein